MALDIDRCIELLKKGDCIPEKDFRDLCEVVKNMLIEESNV